MGLALPPDRVATELIGGSDSAPVLIPTVESFENDREMDTRVGQGSVNRGSEESLTVTDKDVLDLERGIRCR